jgi:predicted nucleotidyltransferase
MQAFADQLRELRTKKGVPLRVVAAYLDIDQAILSKIERGQRKASREMVVKLAKYFKVNENDLMVAWLSDKLVCEVEDEVMALEALKVAEEKVKYSTFKKMDRKDLDETIKKIISRFSKIKKVWIFGSFAREDDGPGSYIDIAVEASENFSYFDLAEVQFELEKSTNRKIDIGFMDSFKPYILENFKNDMKLIYEK